MNVAELYRRTAWTGIGLGTGLYAVTVAVVATNDVPDWLRGSLTVLAMLLILAGVSFKVGSRILSSNEAAGRAVVMAVGVEIGRLQERLDGICRELATLRTQTCHEVRQERVYIGSASSALTNAPTAELRVEAPSIVESAGDPDVPTLPTPSTVRALERMARRIVDDATAAGH